MESRKDFKQAYRTAYLVAGYIRQTLTEAEREELDAWVGANDENMRLFEELTDEKNLSKSLKWFDQMNVEEALVRTRQRAGLNDTRSSTRLLAYVVAATIVLVVGVSIFFMVMSRNILGPAPVNATDDIAPATGKATLTLSDGRVVTISKGMKDTVVEGNIKLSANNGTVVYENGKDPIPDKMDYHTLTIPRGTHYKLELPDGSKVWLNAESSIRYPTSFTGNERRVFVTGETYFEVASNKEKPFRVVTGDVVVEAVGTQFNINAYSDEPFMSTTLVEGSVLVTKGADDNILQPGQQARVGRDGFAVVKVDHPDVTAWKDDLFRFTNSPLDMIMRQVQRWYDAEIVFEEPINFHFNATIERTVPVSKLLALLEKTGHVRFRIEGKKIFIMKQES